MKTQHVSRIVLAATLCWLGGAHVSLADSSSGSSNVGGKTPAEGSVPHDKRTDLTGGQPGVPDEYATTPVRQGSLKDVPDSKWLNKEVTNKQGEKLGKITKVLKDEKTQKEEYVFMEIAGTRDARPLPFARFQQSGDKITLNATKDELMPSINRNETKDMSPDLAMYMDQIEQARSESKPKVGPGDGRGTNRPDPSSGPMGEDKTAGNLGPRAEPPGQAPQFKGDAQKGNQ
jgi:PRC-barrel domain